MGNCVFKPLGFAYISNDNEYKTVKLIKSGDKKAFELFVKEKNIDLNVPIYGKCFWLEDWSLNCESFFISPLSIATNIFQSNIEFLDVMLANGSTPLQLLYLCAYMDEEKQNKFIGLLRIYENDQYKLYYQDDINELMLLYCCQKRNINSLIF